MFSQFFRRLSQITGVALFVELSRVPKINFFDTAQFAEFVRWPKMFDNVPFFSEIIPQRGGGGRGTPYESLYGEPKGVPFPSLLAGGYWGFHHGKPVPFCNRVPCWIFEARAPGYERASANIEGGGRGREKTLSLPPSPRSLCQLSTRPRPNRANSRLLRVYKRVGKSII